MEVNLGSFQTKGLKCDSPGSGGTSVTLVPPTHFRLGPGRRALHIARRRRQDLSRSRESVVHLVTDIFAAETIQKAGDAGGKAHGHRIWDELNHRSESREAQQEQHDPGHHRTDGEIIKTVLGSNPVEDDNKRASRATDANAGAAQFRNN